jgi:hypothetical protein
MDGNPVMFQTGFESDIPVFGQYKFQSVQTRGLAIFYCKNIILTYFPSDHSKFLTRQRRVRSYYFTEIADLWLDRKRS